MVANNNSHTLVPPGPTHKKSSRGAPAFPSHSGRGPKQHLILNNCSNNPSLIPDLSLHCFCSCDWLTDWVLATLLPSIRAQLLQGSEEDHGDKGPPPQLGDLIEFLRPLYQHWGIYVGDGYVVHLTDQEGWTSLASAFGGSAVVRKDRLENVAQGCNYRVNNKYDLKWRPYPPEKVVQAALEQVGRVMPYSVTSANCEHFVTELRYGSCCSEQVANVAMYTAVGGGILAAVLATVAVITRSRRRQNQ
ncbi:phospholipase A and acyltransferase 2-like [Gastrophryne carolinensis]